MIVVIQGTPPQKCLAIRRMARSPERAADRTTICLGPLLATLAGAHIGTAQTVDWFHPSTVGTDGTTVGFVGGASSSVKGSHRVSAGVRPSGARIGVRVRGIREHIIQDHRREQGMDQAGYHRLFVLAVTFFPFRQTETMITIVCQGTK